MVGGGVEAMSLMYIVGVCRSGGVSSVHVDGVPKPRDGQVGRHRRWRRRRRRRRRGGAGVRRCLPLPPATLPHVAVCRRRSTWRP